MSVKHQQVFGINQDVAKQILQVALSTGGQFAEVFMENATSEVFRMRQGKLESTNVSNVKGAAVRVIKDGTEVSASVTIATAEKLLETAKTLADSFVGEKTTEVAEFVEKDVNIVVKPQNIRGENNSAELALLSDATRGATEYSQEIIQVIALLTKHERNIFVFASDGTWQTDHRCNTRLMCQAIASDGKDMQNGTSSFGRNQGMEMFDGFDAVAFGKDAAFLKALNVAPFYAVKVYPTTFGSAGGVTTTEDGRVTTQDGTVIPGLYAAGEMSNRYFYNENYILAASLGLYSTMGRRAGDAAAQDALAK